MKLDLQNVTYTIDNVEGFTFTNFLRILKGMYDTYDGLKRESGLIDQVFEFLEDEVPLKDGSNGIVWDTIEEFTFAECLEEQNLERRRVMFQSIRPENIFKNVESTLIDKQTITKRRTRWDDNDDPFEYTFEDTYELYRLDSSVLFGEENRAQPHIYVVKCVCTTTGREYWIMINNATQGRGMFGSSSSVDEPHLKDAISAIASTIHIEEKDPKKIYRQGDVIIVELWGDERDENKHTSPQPITKEMYLNKMYSET